MFKPIDTPPGEAELIAQCLPVVDAVGYANCNEGSMPLNPFGAALEGALMKQGKATADFVWDKALCQEDSDGDGQSNGELEMATSYI